MVRPKDFMCGNFGDPYDSVSWEPASNKAEFMLLRACLLVALFVKHIGILP